MTCTHIGNAIICHNLFYRLPLADGRRVFIEWHSYLGPTFFWDKMARREIENWWDQPLINDALQWFIDRGGRA